MTSKNLICSLSFIFFALIAWSQENKNNDPEIDAVKTELKKDGLIVIDTLITKKKALNPLAPAKAGFYSAVIPGLGQIYNKKYWKAPIVWAAIGTGIYVYSFNNNDYQSVRTAFKRRQAGFTDDQFYDRSLAPGEVTTRTTPEIDDQRLERLQIDYQNSRDLALLFTILLYALNVVDANVDAHLKQFNIDDDLGLKMDFQPYLNINPITNNPNYGLALTINF